MRAHAVIGADHGDKGKERTVDWLSASPGSDTLVVCTSGGAQAGHTVVAPSGAAHAFHHLDSGALRGAATHLSRHVVSHPMVFQRERAALAASGANVTVSADPRGFVTTQ